MSRTAEVEARYLTPALCLPITASTQGWQGKAPALHSCGAQGGKFFRTMRLNCWRATALPFSSSSSSSALVRALQRWHSKLFPRWSLETVVVLVFLLPVQRRFCMHAVVPYSQIAPNLKIRNDLHCIANCALGHTGTTHRTIHVKYSITSTSRRNGPFVSSSELECELEVK